MVLSHIVPGLTEETSEKAIVILQNCLSHEQEAALILKHAHWNVKGANFIAVHEMIDPEVAAMLECADQTAERIATLGGSPSGRVDDVLDQRTWPVFSLSGRRSCVDYIKALDEYYAVLILESRKAADELDEIDGISSNMIQDHISGFEKFQWFLRSHLE